MTRVDWLVLRRIGSRLFITLFIFFGIILLVESLDTWRFTYLTKRGGPQLALLAIVASAARWTIKTLPVTVLLGVMIGIVDLQMRQELTVIKATGISIWRAMRAPVLALLLASFAVSMVLEGIATHWDRTLDPQPPAEGYVMTPSGEIWRDERSGGQHYILMASAMADGGAFLEDVVIFRVGGGDHARIHAPRATLGEGQWVLEEAVGYNAESRPTAPATMTLPTGTTPAELRLQLLSTEDLTFTELAALLAEGVADPRLRAAALTRLTKLATMPLLLVGSLLIAFAFTAGYRKTHKYGTVILSGLVLGLAIFVITEMADRAGSSGVLDPTLAAAGPAFVAIVIGVTVLLHKEDGRA